jgi:hypothetical protein
MRQHSASQLGFSYLLCDGKHSRHCAKVSARSMKKLISSLPLSLLLVISSVAQLPVESVVTLTAESSPRSAATSEAKTWKTATLTELMGLLGGNVICVADALDHTKPWVFKHRSTSGVETDLSDKLMMEVIGVSEVGSHKNPAPVAPTKNVKLGRVTSSRTVKVKISPKPDLIFEFWGSLAVNYMVTQSAGRTDANWVPANASIRMAGIWGDSPEADMGAASLKMVVGAFKRVVAVDAAALAGIYSGTIHTNCAGVSYTEKMRITIGADGAVVPDWTTQGALRGGSILSTGAVTGMSITIKSASRGSVEIPFSGSVSGTSLSLTGHVGEFQSSITATRQ